MTETHRLPLLSARRAELETCGYCPKLCRAGCPVSNAEPRDTITPWGKMTTAWLASRGLVEVDADHAMTAWACTGCHACRDRCDHRNPVAATLGDGPYPRTGGWEKESNDFLAAISVAAAYDLASLDWGVALWTPPDVPAEAARAQASPNLHVSKDSKPLLIMHSEGDLRCPVEQADQFFVALRLLQRNVEMVRFASESHELSRSGSPAHRRQRMEIILDFFGRHLSPATS